MKNLRIVLFFIVSMCCTLAIAASNPFSSPNGVALDDINQVQRALARQHIPGLVIFLANIIALAILLQCKAHDLKILRKQKFFQNLNSLSPKENQESITPSTQSKPDIQQPSLSPSPSPSESP